MRAKSAVLAAIVAATTGLSSGCATANLHEETRARPATGLAKTCCNFGWGGPKSFFLPGGSGDGKATLVATAIPGVPLCAAGAVVSAPFCLLATSPGPALVGALVMDFIGTPAIAPFWLIGRFFDGLASDHSTTGVPSRPTPIPSTPQSTTPLVQTAAPAKHASAPPMRQVESGEWRIEGDGR